MVYPRPNPPGGAVHLLDGRGDPFQEEHGTLLRQHGILASHPLDLAHRLPHALDGGQNAAFAHRER